MTESNGPAAGVPLRARSSHQDPSAIFSWAPLALVALLFAIVVRQAARPLSDPDTFWHLRMGHEVIANRSVAAPDWTTGDDRAFVLTQWLPEVVMAWTETHLGLPGVAWLYGSSLVVLLAVVYRTCRQHAGVLPAGFTAALCLAAMSASLSPRPHMVTYVFLTLTVAAWLRTAQDQRTRWWLIPLTWLWACSHGMWFTGPIVGITAVCGMTLDRRGSGRELGRHLLVPVLSVVAATLTPVGPELLAAPFAVGEVGAFITEWQPPSFRSVGPAAGAGLVAIIVLTWARSGRAVSWTSLLLLALAVGWILLAVRTVAIGAVIVAPLAAAALQSGIARAPEPYPARSERWLVPLTAALSLIALAVAVPRVAEDPANVPSGLNARLDRLPPGTPVLNDYAVGGWLRWEHSDLDPLIDGLTEAYTLDELQDYARMTAVAEGWSDVVAASGASIALLPTGSPLATALQERLAWDPVDDSAGYVLLTESDDSGSSAS